MFWVSLGGGGGGGVDVVVIMATEMEFLGNLSFLSRSIDQRKERIDTQLILVLRLLTFAWFRVGCSDFFAFSNVNLVLLVFH